MNFKDIIDDTTLDEDGNYDELIEYDSELNELDDLDDEAIMAIDGKFDDVFLEGRSGFKKLVDDCVPSPYADFAPNIFNCPLCDKVIGPNDEDHILTCNRNKG